MRLKLLMLNEYFPPYAPGGAEWSLLRLAKALVDRGHEVHVLTPDLGKERIDLPDSLKVTYFPFRHKVKTGFQLSPYILGNPFFYSCFGRAATNYLQNHKIDLIHAHNVHSMPAAVIAKMRYGIPAVATVRDYRMLCPSAICLLKQDELTTRCDLGKFHECLSDYRSIYNLDYGPAKRIKFRVRRSWEWLDWKLRRHYFRELDAAIFVGKRIMEIHRAAGLTAERMTSIWNLPPVPDEKTPDIETVLQKFNLVGKRIVLHAGRVSVGKGGKVLYDAAKLLKDVDPDVCLVLAGRLEIPDLAGGERLRLLGHVSHDDLLALYQAAEIFIAASVWQEPFSRSILEAMNYGLPVIASKAGGNEESVIDKQTGLIINRNDPLALVDALKTLLNDRELAKRYGANGQKLLLERFSEVKLLDSLELFYQEIIAGAR